MGKVLQFKKVAKPDRQVRDIETLIEGVDNEIDAIANDFSLTPANRRWLLENMLMDIDEKLEEYKQELEEAERRLEQLAQSSEKSIEAAYNEYVTRITDLTKSVQKLTRKLPT